MAADDYSLIMAPTEDLFGGGSRTRHVILKRRSASLSQSAFSCQVFEKVAPNRDYPYEGLFAMVGPDYWKFIDTIALGVQSNGRQLKLAPAEVKATPWSCEYSYEADGLAIRAMYYLYKVNNGASGYMDVSIEGPGARSSKISFEPYFDVRFMYDQSAPENIQAGVSGDILTAMTGGPTVCLSATGSRYVRKGRQIEWKYKLRGDRCR